MPMSKIRIVVPLMLVASAQAHVTLPPGGATAGSVYSASFRVGHACKGAASTTSIKVRLPKGFTPIEVEPRPGWSTSFSADEARWTATTPQAALPANERANFVVRGQLTDQPGTLWFKVLQVCDNRSADWAAIPAREGDKPALPAARLDVLPPGEALIDVQDAWARIAVPGQSATGVFAKLTASAGARLVGGSTPVAATVEVHEMKLEGDVMRMRALDSGLELPAGETIELGAGGYHLMLSGLKRALPAGASVPLTLRFVDGQGRHSALELQVPVLPRPVGARHEHQHR